jgi:hypothetical protein
MDSISVKVGDVVTVDNSIGNTGTTGRSTGVHLHLGMFSSNTWDKPFDEKDWTNPDKIIDMLIELEKPKPEPVVPTPEPVKPEPIAPFKIGDRVIITGRGNGSSYGGSNIAGGIGWTRVILAIHSGRKFPYQVGLGKSTTGFYQESALRKVV